MCICMGPRQPSPPAPPRRGRALPVLRTGLLLDFVKRGSQRRAIWQRSPSHSLLFVSRRELRGQIISAERVHSYLFMSIKPGGTLELGPGFSDPGVPTGWGKGEHRLPPPLLYRGWGLSLRASGSHSRTLCGPRLRCKARCASRKSHRLSVGN